MHGAVDRAVHDQVGDLNLAIDPRVLADHKGTRLIGKGAYVAAHDAVDTQPPAEEHVAFNSGRAANKAVDAVLGLAGFAEHGVSLRQDPSVTLCVALACAVPVSKMRTWMVPT